MQAQPGTLWSACSFDPDSRFAADQDPISPLSAVAKVDKSVIIMGFPDSRLAC